MVQTGYAKDGVAVIAYPVNPTTFGTSSTAPYSSINGGVVGPVALGWLPGDPNAGPFTGTSYNAEQLERPFQRRRRRRNGQHGLPALVRH